MLTLGFCLVPRAGIEPARLAAGDFESPTSTNFITRAYRCYNIQLQVTTYFTCSRIPVKLCKSLQATFFAIPHKNRCKFNCLKISGALTRSLLSPLRLPISPPGQLGLANFTDVFPCQETIGDKENENYDVFSTIYQGDGRINPAFRVVRQ